MEKRVIIALMAVVATASGVRAQSDDFGVWGEIGVEKKLSKRLSVAGELEFRSRDNVSEADRWSVGLGADYKLAGWLKASAGYSLLDDHNYKLNNSGKKYADYWGTRHRFNVSLTAAQSFGRLNVSLRERWQYTYRPEQTVTRYYVASGNEADDHTYRGKGKNAWRNRLQLKYKVDKFWRPYVSAESSVSGSGLDKIRYSAGTELRLTKHQALDVKYVFQKSYKDTDDEGNRHVLGIGYTYKF